MRILLERSELHQEASFKKEFVMGNGIGGYVSTSILSTNERKHHGYLIASLNPPTKRMMILAKVDELIQIGEQEINLCSSNLVVNPLLKSFDFEYYPSWYFESEAFRITKQIAPYYEHNTVAITYEIESFEQSMNLSLKPFFTMRDHSDVSSIDKIKFVEDFEGQIKTLKHEENTIYFFVSEGEYIQNKEFISHVIEYSKDIETGDNRSDYYQTPFSVLKKIPAFSKVKIEVICSIESIPQISAFQLIKQYKDRMEAIISNELTFYLDDDLKTHFKRLLYAADQFVVKRNSTEAFTVLAGYPWFTDWGRDTMIAFEGLLLSTSRFDDAKEVLLSFQKYLKNGLIPNMFPDEGSAPLYNTVDASLWYINAIYLYATYTKEIEETKELFFPTIEAILTAYQNGTDFSIHMDEDYLIHAGSGLDQVTWMDVRINGEVVTPRHGKPVEINALWYNAFRIADYLTTYGQEQLFASKYELFAREIKKQFNLKFWNKEKKALFDVIDEIDDSIRPNQLYAISLPFPVITTKKAKKVLQRIETELLDIKGLRSLSVLDPRFKKEYSGDIVSRDFSYHMGTSWGFLLGTYFYTYLVTYKQSYKALKKVKPLLLNALKETEEGCLFGYAEVFDGLEGTVPKGCYSQAWSVAEFIRVLDLLAKGRL